MISANLPSAAALAAPSPVAPTPLPARMSILDKNMNKMKGAEVNLSAFSLLFSELVLYSQDRVHGIEELEKRLFDIGYQVGHRIFELITWRERTPKRETRVLGVLYFIHSVVWKAVFAKPADSLEKSTDAEDEYMIADNEPVVSKFISVPRELSQLNCAAYSAGLVQAVLEGCGIRPVRVTAHSVPAATHPQRTVILIKLDGQILRREEQLDQ